MTPHRRDPTGNDVDGLLGRLRSIVGAEHVRTDGIDGYLVDWTGSYRGAAAGVVRPGSIDEVALVLRCVAEHQRVAVTIQGGNTGLVGGSVPPPADPNTPAIVLLTTRLNTIGAVDPVNRTMTVGAGATLAAAEAVAARAGLSIGVDLAARDSATIGGMVATNAGGIRFLRHGGMRQRAVGMTAVLPDGSVIDRSKGLPKDNVGYDLTGLLAGSEGTLAVICSVVLDLVPRLPKTSAAALVSVDSAAQAIGLARAVEAAGLPLQAAELVLRPGIDLVGATHPELRPAVSPDARAAALIEVSAPGRDSADTVELLANVLARQGLTEATLAPFPASKLWAVRERHTEVIAAASATPVLKLDISVPLDRLDETIATATEIAGQTGTRLIAFGHFLDGNLHLNYLDIDPPQRDSLTDRVLRVVNELGGSISAEHGIGRAKRPWLALGRSRADIAAMRAIKDALDPHGTLNPGVIFPDHPIAHGP